MLNMKKLLKDKKKPKTADQAEMVENIAKAETHYHSVKGMELAQKSQDKINGAVASEQSSITSSPQTNKPDFDALIAKHDEKASAESAEVGEAAGTDIASPSNAPDVFTDEQFLHFYTSIFKIAGGLTKFESLICDPHESHVIDGFNGIYRIAERHPRMRWMIKPLHEDLADGAAAFALFGGMAKGVAVEIKAKKLAKLEAEQGEAGAAPQPEAEKAPKPSTVKISRGRMVGI